MQESGQKEFEPADLLAIVARMIKDRLDLLQQIDKAEAQTLHLHRQASRERLALISLALGVIGAHQRYCGIRVP